MVKRILVLVIEENRLVRDGLAAVLDAQPDFKVVAAAEGAIAGLQQLSETKPHVVLVNAALGTGDGHRLVESVKKTAPESRVVVMDLLPAQQDVIEFIKAGANGFIVKDATVDDFVRTIRSVADGEDVVPPSLTATLLSHIADSRRAPATMDATRMTKREREITELIAEGLSNKEIAQRLNIATYTVKSHVHNILEKQALHSRLQIAAQAHRSSVNTDHAAGRPPAAPPVTSADGNGNGNGNGTRTPTRSATLAKLGL
jgi:two-component system, NarL family, nitrate/nitrite response regulator NarL